MFICEKCGKETDELYEVNGQKMCEECAIAVGGMKSPSKQCGPDKS